jgi:DNA polymerase III subunit epsilon
MRQIFLDTETTGLSPENGDRIVEIGCVELLNRKLTGNNLHFYLNPERDSHEDALKVHGISNEFLKDKPKFGEIADELLEYLQGADLLIHNAPFDVGFINKELELQKARRSKPMSIALRILWLWPKTCFQVSAIHWMRCATA